MDVDVDDFRDAEPDPLHADEHDLLADLNDHHLDELSGLAGQVTGEVEACRAVRLDRYGMVVATGRRRLRLPFAQVLADVCELPLALHAMSCPGCRSEAFRVG